MTASTAAQIQKITRTRLFLFCARQHAAITGEAEMTLRQ